jgi:hypothetical protein
MDLAQLLGGMYSQTQALPLLQHLYLLHCFGVSTGLTDTATINVLYHNYELRCSRYGI